MENYEIKTFVHFYLINHDAIEMTIVVSLSFLME